MYIHMYIFTCFHYKISKMSIKKFTHYRIRQYFAKLEKIWRYCSKLVISTFQQTLIVEADVVFYIKNQTVIE